MAERPAGTHRQGATEVEYRILGPLEVRIDGESLDLGPKKQRSLFALLLVNHGRTVSTDRILDALWG
ncbi:MAG: AfsR/SARP family transcriptional regulator, partial [Acidimicrobiia bacterium]